MIENNLENVRVLNFTADENYSGWLVRDIIKKYYRISAKTLARLKRSEDGILLNGSSVTVRAKVNCGDVLTLRLAEEPTEFGAEDSDYCGVIPVELPLSIVYEDEDIIIVNKPPYMPTHPSHGHLCDTLANALSYLYRVERGKSDYVFRTVNRLDRNTSGLLCVAKNKYAASVMCDNMVRGKIHKTYLAVVDGIPESNCGTIDTYIRRREDSIIVRIACESDEAGSMRAITNYTVIGKGEGHALVRLEPLTGRTHQLRVHMAHIGCPITGDEIYGSADKHIGRHALHAEKLELPLVTPNADEYKTFFAPVPDDMDHLMEKYSIRME